MKIKTNLFLILLIVAISSCASNTQPIKYYSLNLNDFQTSNKAISANQIRVLVEPIQLAKFLDQDNMVIQIGKHEIYKANSHRWAEPLDQSIVKLLVKKLNNKTDNTYQFVKRGRHESKNPSLHLYLEIDQFHSTDNAQVILSGHYWLYSEDHSFETMKYFNISDGLTGDGYQHSVEKLICLLGQLVMQITNTIKEPRG